MAREWDRPEEHDHVLVIADDDPAHLALLRQQLERVPGRDRAATLGRYPRFEVIVAEDGDEAIRRTTRRVTALAVDLMMPRTGGLDVILRLRPQRADLAILAFTAAAPPSEAVAANSPEPAGEPGPAAKRSRAMALRARSAASMAPSAPTSGRTARNSSPP